jgi:hypothetical protein
MLPVLGTSWAASSVKDRDRNKNTPPNVRNMISLLSNLIQSPRPDKPALKQILDPSLFQNPVR